MNNIKSEVTRAQEILKKIAFQAAQKESTEEIYSMALDGFAILANIEKISTTENVKKDELRQNELNEIEKISRKLKLWAKPEKQENINSKILNAFLELRESGNYYITKGDIEKKLSDPSINIYNNLQQMMNIAEKNHGKIFEQKTGYIDIWSPVKEFVDIYGDKVLSIGY